MRFILVLILYSFTAGAEVGFHEISDPLTPPAVVHAQSSVFQIVVPAGKRKTMSVEGLDDE